MVNGRDPGRARVVIRFYGGDGRRHVYLAEVLADKNCLQLHPVCHRSLGYQLAHPVDMLSPCSFAISVVFSTSAGSALNGCDSRRTRYSRTTRSPLCAASCQSRERDTPFGGGWPLHRLDVGRVRQTRPEGSAERK